MGKIAELAAKFQTLLTKIHTAVASKLDATATAVNSDKLEGKSLSEVRSLSSADAVSQVASDDAPRKGLRGEIAYFNEDNSPMAIKGMPLLKTVNLVASDADVATAKAATVPFSEIFNKWRRISHSPSGIFPANESELSGWSYDSVTDTVSSTINSATVIGLISNDRFGEYVFETIMKSTDADNDGVGFCLAFNKVGDREHTLIAMIDSGGLAGDGSIPNGDVPKLVLAVNYGQGASWGHQVIAQLPFGLAGQGWTGVDFAAGVKLIVKRMSVGMLEITCTRADGSPWPTPVYWTGEIPEQFSGPCAIGLVAFSQAGSSWEITQMPTIKRDIIDTRTMDVWRWNGNAWVIAGNLSDPDVMMPGRIYKNTFAAPYLSFYLDHDGSTYVLGGPGQIGI